MDDPSHEAFLREFLRGGDAAARQVERWAREVVRFRNYGMTTEEREDVVQESLAQLWRQVSSPDFRLERSVRSLVRTIAGARCIDRLRRRRPTAELPESLEDASSSPYQDLFARERGAQLRWALQNVSESCQEVIRLHFFEGLRYRAIAERLGRAESTLRVRMFQCMKKLRQLLDPVRDDIS